MLGPHEAHADEQECTENDGNHEKKLKVLVSTIDSASKPIVFFAYPTYVQSERPCPTGYKGQ